MFSMKILLILTTAFLLWNAEAEDVVEEKDWIDPTDMINYDPIRKTMRNQNEFSGTVQKVLANVDSESDEMMRTKCSEVCSTASDCESNTALLMAELASFNATVNELRNQVVLCKALREQTFFKQYVKVLLERFKNLAQANDRHYNVQIKLTAEQYGYLYNYSHSEQGSLQEVHTILVSMHQNVSWSGTDLFVGVVREFWPDLLRYLLIACQVVCGICSILLLCRHYPRDAWWISTRLFFVMFLVSVVWNWLHLYQKEVAALNARTMKGMPESCLTPSASLFDGILSFFKLKSNECTRYYEDQEINPILLVSPAKAVVVTISSLLPEPAKHIGEALNGLTVAAFDLPIYLWPLVYGMLILVLVFIVLSCCNYRLRTPFFNIEPHPLPDPQLQELALLNDRVRHLQNLNAQLEVQLQQVQLDSPNAERHPQLQEISHLSDELDQLQSRNAQQEVQLQQLESRNENLEEQLHILQDHNAHLEIKLEQLQSRNENLEEQLQQLQSSIAQLDVQPLELHEYNNQLEVQLQQLRLEMPTFAGTRGEGDHLMANESRNFWISHSETTHEEYAVLQDMNNTDT